MLFNSLEYCIFLPIVALVYWLLPRVLKVPFLIIASYFFYMSWMKVYGLLLFGLTAINYAFGLIIAKLQQNEQKRLALIVGITLNLGCLAIFKYTNFILDSVKGSCLYLSQIFHISIDSNLIPASLPIILPLGISFFVFEFIHYLVDIRAGQAPIKNPLRFSLFASFFPSQIAGPIKRYEDFDAQVGKQTKFNKEMFSQGIVLITQGMFKKVALGDNLASIVNTGYTAPQLMGTTDAWLCTIAFALQIYYDFSGYTDIGLGSAKLLGFNLPINFNMPYLATSLQDFWHRWHISLSTWLRDYLYIPLGGSKKGSFNTLRNLVITMLLGGLWHGASWHFVFWGGFHGVGLVINRLLEQVCAKISVLNAFSKSWLWSTIGSRVLTFVVVLMSWVLFRADTLHDATTVYKSMFVPTASHGLETSIDQLFLHSVLPTAFLIYSMVYLVNWLISNNKLPQMNILNKWWINPPLPARIVILAGIYFLIVGLAPPVCIPFIYFQF